MAKEIKVTRGYDLEVSERILTLEEDLAPTRPDHKVIIKKVSGTYRLQITFFTGNPIPPDIDLPLGPKIPPDTGIALTSKERAKLKKKKAKKK